MNNIATSPSLLRRVKKHVSDCHSNEIPYAQVKDVTRSRSCGSDCGINNPPPPRKEVVIRNPNTAGPETEHLVRGDWDFSTEPSRSPTPAQLETKLDGVEDVRMLRFFGCFGEKEENGYHYL